MIDSGSRILQIVHSARIIGKNDGEQWFEVAATFSPDADFYDELMIGAAQVSGPGNFVSFDYISLLEV